MNSEYSFSASQRVKTGFSLSTLILITFTQISSDSTEFYKDKLVPEKKWLSPKIPKLAGAALRLQGFVWLFSATPFFSVSIVILQSSFVLVERAILQGFEFL